jgi:hypothetical protein
MTLRVALAALTIGVLAPAASGASVHPAPLRDISKLEHIIPPSRDHVDYHGGRVLHSNRTHLIFWQPRGSGLTFGPGYVSLVERFMRNVAAASHSTSNLFGLTGQYTDYNGRPAAYASHYGGSLMDTDPLPANGCVEPSTGPHWTRCLTDSQLQAELEHVVRVHGLPHGPDDVYFLLTPRGLASCLSPGSCSVAGPPNGYCAYHGMTYDGLLLYAVIAYTAVPKHCQSWRPRPNRSTADPTVSVVSHELAEMVTDPDQDAWYDNAGAEIGDICLTSYGRAVGGSGANRYNEIINGGRYYLQEEWSNADHACRPRAEPDRASFTVTRRSSRTDRLWLVARGSDPYGHIVSYHWFFADGSRARGRKVSHRFATGGSYRITLRVTDDWGNWAFYTRAVTVRGG